MGHPTCAAVTATTTLVKYTNYETNGIFTWHFGLFLDKLIANYQVLKLYINYIVTLLAVALRWYSIVPDLTFLFVYLL